VLFSNAELNTPIVALQLARFASAINCTVGADRE
jgi:hypothetical protein